MNSTKNLVFDFVNGEVRELSDEEWLQQAAEQMRRYKAKNGIVYIDCDPPED